MEITVNTDQIKTLEQFFNDLSSINQRKVFMAGFRRAAKPLITAAKSATPYDTGTLYKSIGTMEIPNEVAILVGAKKSGKYKGWHGHLVENGTKERFRRSKDGARTGKVTGVHFFEHAYDSTQEQMYSQIEQTWYEEIDRFIIKVNKKK